MKKFFFVVLALVVTSLNVYGMELSSPDKRLKVTLQLQNANGSHYGQVFFKVDYVNGQSTKNILPISPLGLIREDQKFSNNLDYIDESKIIPVHDKYEMLLGKCKVCENFGNEKIFRFKNSDNKNIEIAFRAYNNGVAFRYGFSDAPATPLRVIDELTAYSIPAGTKRWVQPFEASYENFFPADESGKSADSKQEWGYPALFNMQENIYMLVSEANLSRTNLATRLTNKENISAYKVGFPSPRKDYKEVGSKFIGAWNSAWRVLMIGSLADVVSSSLITDLSAPSKLKDTKWIKPGAASWIYWANNHGSKDFKALSEYVDLAVAMKWPYTLIDWEWDAMSNGGTIEDLTKYAASKGIKPLMWYNSGTAWLDPTPVDHLLTAEKRAKEFAWLNKIGVYGIKVDFFAGDQQDMMNYYIDILEDAAKYHLLVNFHGATIPRGWQRTYPNLMTTEAVYGAEWYNNVATFTDKAAAHNTVLPFTRNVIGPMDYTPVTFSNSQHPHITSYAHELALSVIFESGIQHFADRPSAYYALPDDPRKFLQSVPTTWDETILVDGYPGEYVVMARRKGTKWYLAGINGTNNAKTFSFNLPFIKKGAHLSKLIADGADDKSFSTINSKLTSQTTLTVPSLARGGFVGIIE